MLIRIMTSALPCDLDVIVAERPLHVPQHINRAQNGQ